MKMVNISLSSALTAIILSLSFATSSAQALSGGEKSSSLSSQNFLETFGHICDEVFSYFTQTSPEKTEDPKLKDFARMVANYNAVKRNTDLNYGKSDEKLVREAGVEEFFSMVISDKHTKVLLIEEFQRQLDACKGANIKVIEAILAYAPHSVGVKSRYDAFECTDTRCYNIFESLSRSGCDENTDLVVFLKAYFPETPGEKDSDKEKR